MRVWLDDIRDMPHGFDLHVKTAAEAIEILRSGEVTFISLDHDLSFNHYQGVFDEEREPTGYTVACWIEEAVAKGEIPMPDWRVHSANPVGAQRIQEAMMSAMVYAKKREEEEA